MVGLVIRACGGLKQVLDGGLAPEGSGQQPVSAGQVAVGQYLNLEGGRRGGYRGREGGVGKESVGMRHVGHQFNEGTDSVW